MVFGLFGLNFALMNSHALTWTWWGLPRAMLGALKYEESTKQKELTIPSSEMEFHTHPFHSHLTK